MTLQVHPIAIGCMLVVAFGTLIYTYMTTRQQSRQYSYGSSSHFDETASSVPPLRTSSSDNFGPPSRKRKTNDDCSICLSAIKSSSKTLTCQHVFHSHCITMWLNSNTTCPICRREAKF